MCINMLTRVWAACDNNNSYFFKFFFLVQFSFTNLIIKKYSLMSPFFCLCGQGSGHIDKKVFMIVIKICTMKDNISVSQVTITMLLECRYRKYILVPAANSKIHITYIWLIVMIRVSHQITSLFGSSFTLNSLWFSCLKKLSWDKKKQTCCQFKWQPAFHILFCWLLSRNIFLTGNNSIFFYCEMSQYRIEKKIYII